MWRRFVPSTRWRKGLTNGAAGVAVASVVAVGLAIDDSVVTQVEAQTTGIWLPVESTGELVLIDPSTGVATNRVRVTEPQTPVEVIDSPDLVGVVERESGNLVTVDTALGEVSGRAPLEISDISDLVVTDAAWVIGASGVARVPLNRTQPDLIDVPGPSTSAAGSGPGLALVINDTKVDVDRRGSSTDGDPVFGLAVTNAGGHLATITPPNGTVRLDDGISTCIHGDVDGDTIWGGSTTGDRVVVGANGADGTLHVSLLDDDRCRLYQLVEGAAEAARFSEPLVVDNVVYVVNTTDGQLYIVDLDTDVERSVGVFRPGEPVELIHHRDDVIVHEPRTFRGAVVGPEGVRQLIDKSAGRPLVSVVSDDSSLVVGGSGDGAVAGADADGDAFSGDLTIEDPVVLGADEVTTQEETEELVANFAFSAARVQVGVPVTFVDESTGDPRSWTWDFGDGTNGSGPRVEHAWSAAGTYQVTLFVDREDASASRSAFIEVVPEETILAPTADFVFSELTVAVDDPVVLTDVTVGDVTERQWDLGDGTTATEVEVVKSWAAPGSYTVTLTVANEAGADSASATITVVERLESPTAVIEVDALDVEVGEPVRLRSVSTGDVSRVVWDFGDGTFDTSTDVIKSYRSEGSYTVSLTVSNSAGSSTASVVVEVMATTLPPEARIAAPPSIIESGISTTLASISLNDPHTLEWEFGDGGTASGTPVTYTWEAPGTYVVTLTATNDSGTNSTSVAVTVLPYLPPPIAAFTSPDPIRVGTPAEFVDTSANGTTYLWDFGDGGSATTVPAIHTYSEAGTVTVTLTVENRNGSATASDTVEVLPALPVAGFTSSPAAVRVNESVFFADTSTGAATYVWDFGDGATSTVASPSHAYALSGDYLVTLTVGNGNNEFDSFSATVSVDPAAPLLGPITAAPSPGVTLSLTTFTVTPAVGSGPIVDYTWDFGDGGTATTLVGTATHTYASAGTYNVTVVASGALAGDVAAAAIGYDVADPPPPIITMSVSPDQVELNATATLTATPSVGSGPIVSYAWDFGDGTTATGAVVTKAWAGLGEFMVSVVATGPVETGSAGAPVEVVPPPPPLIANAFGTPSPGFTNQVVNFTAQLAATSGPVNSWLWDFGDGTSSTLQNPPKTYAVDATYTVTVTAFGPVAPDEFVFSFTVDIPPPVLTTPTYTPIVPLQGDTVAFSVASGALSGPITSYLWTFHDLSTSTLANPTFTYPTAGSYQVSVTATGPGGTSSPANVTVFVYQPIAADFTVSQPGPVGELPPSTVFFTDASTGPPPASWSWNFGDGSGTSALQNPSYDYATPGIYNITLTVTDAMGRSSMRTRIFNVL